MPRNTHDIKELRAMDTPPHRARLEGKVECRLPGIPHYKGRWAVSPLISEPILSSLTSSLGTPPAAYARVAWGAAVSWWRLGFRKYPSRPSSSLNVDDHATRRSNGSTAGHLVLEPHGSLQRHLQEGKRRPRASLSLPPGWTSPIWVWMDAHFGGRDGGRAWGGRAPPSPGTGSG
jgi:hypothetical protein